MASSRSSVIQFSDDKDARSELQFQDFTLDSQNANIATLSPSESHTNFAENPDIAGDESEDLLGSEGKPSASLWEFSYYQSFFDVDTDEVCQRILWSMVPLSGRATFLDRQVRPKPDLYGPFWITATLILSAAICANIAVYLRTEGLDAKLWNYDFHKVSLAATAVYSYAFLLPIMLWGILWYRKNSSRFTLLEILCVYGYSLAIYVPISVLCVINVPVFQWIIVLIGAGLSGTVLLQTFWPVLREESKKIAAVILCLILLFHVLLAVGFVAYFFHSPTGMKPTSTSETTAATINAIPEKLISPAPPVVDMLNHSSVKSKPPLQGPAADNDVKEKVEEKIKSDVKREQHFGIKMISGGNSTPSQHTVPSQEPGRDQLILSNLVASDNA